MNEVQKIAVQQVLKGLVGGNTGRPQLVFAMKRADKKWDVSNRDGAITVRDEPPAGFGYTEVRIIETERVS